MHGVQKAAPSFARSTDPVGHLTRARFGRASRLTTSNEFARVFEEANRSADRFFTVLGRRNDLGQPRLGLAISKRVAKRAVDRNRLKRLARESFRSLELVAPIDFVVMARPAATKTDNGALRHSLDTHFLRLCGQGA